MHHFFAEPSNIKDGKINIHGSDVNHMKQVLRMKPGELVEVSDSEGKKYLCEVEVLQPELAILAIVEERVSDTELASKLYLFQGLPKSDKMELIIQKAVELGAYEIIPVATRRAVVKLDEKKAHKKTERWQAISESAAKQSDRSRIPKVKAVMDFPAALDYAAQLDVILIPYELAEGMNATRQVIGAITPGQSVGIFIGPEGGFERAEIELAAAKGAMPVTLGKRILRTETAGLAILSVLMYHLEG